MGWVSRYAPLSGLIAAVLFGAGSALWGFEQPAQDASSEEIVSFYEGTSTEILIGGTVSIVSFPFFVWFGAILRERLQAAEGGVGSGLPLVAFAGTVLIVAAGLGAETINMAGAMSADDGQLTADTAQVYFDVSWAFGAPAAGVAIAMTAAAVALVALRTGGLFRPSVGVADPAHGDRDAHTLDVDRGVPVSGRARGVAAGGVQRSAVPGARARLAGESVT